MADSVNRNGAASIVDRVEGWGHTDGSDSNRKDNDTWGSAQGNSVTANDASKEAAATRVGRYYKARKSFKEAVDPAIADRTTGFGTAFDPTAGAGGYVGDMGAETPASLGDATDYANGVFYDESDQAETGTGSNTAAQTTDSEHTTAGRTADSRDTVLLNDDDAASRTESARTSLRDRTDGWGHTDGTMTYRKDA